MPVHEGAHRRNLDLVIFADQLGRRPILEGATTMFAMGRDVVADLVGSCGQRPPMALMAGLRSARPGVLPPLLAIRRRRPGRRARRLLRPLQPQHQIDQLLLGKALQLVPIHRVLEASNRRKRKSLAKFPAHGRIAKLTSPVGNYAWRMPAQSARCRAAAKAQEAQSATKMVSQFYEPVSCASQSR